MLDAPVAQITPRLAGGRLEAAPLEVTSEPLRQVLALRILDLAALMMRATAILLLLSPAVIGALLVFG
jgi:hypothetical protein